MNHGPRDHQSRSVSVVGKQSGNCSLALLYTVLLLLVAGCTPAANSNFVSYLFDGVPAPPPPAEYCADYISKREAVVSAAAKLINGAVSKESIHPPYAAKKCDSCHDRSKEGGFVVARNQLCVSCHPKILAAFELHAPAASGNCTACHVPHSATVPYLLKTNDRNQLCEPCHQEPRTAPKLHSRATAAKLLCTDCHNPHAGTVRYFLR